MKKILYLLTVISLFSISASAQSQQYTRPDLSYGIHPGTITDLNGQVTNGYIENGDYTHNEKKCVFYTDYNDKNTKKVYKPAELKGYSIENIQYKSIAYSGNISFGKPDQQFVFIARPGAITTFVYWAPEEQLVWQKGDDAPVSNSSMMFGFKKNMIKLVGDDTELADKINNKEKGYGLTSIDKIIDEYNTWAQAQKK